MSVELEALVGHLFVVDGRSVSTASPGAVASPPPRRAARGRDTDTFFGLITLGQEHRAPASFYERLVGLVSAKYFSTGGSVTSALREAIDAINVTARAENANLRESVTIGFACAVLRENELIIAIAGPARCMLIRREETVERLPDAFEIEEGLVPLGYDREADIRLYRREMQAGDFLVLADTALDQVRDSSLHYAVEKSRVEDTISNLRGVVGPSATAVVIQFVAPVVPETEGEIRENGQLPVAPSREIEASHEAGEQEVSWLSGNLAPTARRAGRSAAMSVAQVAGNIRALVGRVSQWEEEDVVPVPSRLSAATHIGVAVAVAVIVALLTTAIYRFRGLASQYAQLVAEANNEVEAARAAGADQASARPHWERALFLLDQAEAVQSGSPAIAEQRTEALSALDSYDHVTRVDLGLLREYPAGAYLRGPILHGLNVYVIDTTADILYREDLVDTGGMLSNRESQIITRQGELIGDQVVGGLIDLAWVEEGASPQRNVLAALSRNGLLITYSPSFAVSAGALPGSQAWQDPRAIAFFDGDLYLLDPGADEIWRYETDGEGYSRMPERYFTDIEPGLTDAVDMDVDSNGRLYVLHADGRITKYFLGREEMFTFQGLPQPIARPTALNLNTGIYDPAFYIADAGGGRLYTTTTTTGTFLRNYKDREGYILGAISGVFSEPGSNYVYVTAGNGLYRFERP